MGEDAKDLKPLVRETCSMEGIDMNRIQINKWILFLLAFLLTASGGFCAALADHDDHGKGHRYQKGERKRSGHNGKHNMAPVNNLMYSKNCGSCHFTYQPGLLPSGSWHMILKRLPEHFGEDVDVDEESRKTIAEYLQTNAADYSPARVSTKIMRSLGPQTPPRITQIPYIKHKHHDIRPAVFERASIGSPSNCVACHTTAENGIYDDDNVMIPR
jgi:Dihaem cytochrome c